MNTELLELLNRQLPVTVQHYKRKTVYQVITVGTHTESHQRFVVYKAVSYPQDNQVWIRPIEEFCEIVEDDNGNKISRFTVLNIN